MTVIKDGTGQGFLARVTNKNKLAVDATTTPDGSDIADEGFAFFVDGTTSIVASVEKTVIVIVNTGNIIYEIGRVFISAQNQQPPATGAGSTITTIKMYLGTVTATGGTSKTPVNANTASLNLANVSSLVNNPTISGTDNEIKQMYFMLNDSQLISFEGSIVLAPSGSFRVTCTGGAGIAGGPLCAVSVQFYQEL